MDRKVVTAEIVGTVAYGLWRNSAQGRLWYLKLDCGHGRQCAAFEAPTRFACLDCDMQLMLPMHLPRQTETWR